MKKSYIPAPQLCSNYEHETDAYEHTATTSKVVQLPSSIDQDSYISFDKVKHEETNDLNEGDNAANVGPDSTCLEFGDSL